MHSCLYLYIGVNAPGRHPYASRAKLRSSEKFPENSGRPRLHHPLCPVPPNPCPVTSPSPCLHHPLSRTTQPLSCNAPPSPASIFPFPKLTPYLCPSPIFPLHCVLSTLTFWACRPSPYPPPPLTFPHPTHRNFATATTL